MDCNKNYNEDCLETMSRMPDDFVDLTVTSPPYDNLRTYKGYSFQFKDVIRELYRVMKPGGVVVWIVGDATVKGSETGSSFRQALYAKEVGFRLHDTMIWRKTNPTPVDPRIHRYTAAFEYMFVWSKGKPAMGELVRTECKTAGKVRGYTEHASQLKKDGTKRTDRAAKRAGKATGLTKILDNVWDCSLPRGGTGHPAVFPEKLVADHIISWSDVGGLVYDPFMGSGTTAKVAILARRRWIGSEISTEYCKIIDERVAKASKASKARRTTRMCRVEDLTGVPRAFMEDIAKSSASLNPDDHDIQCPVRHGASTECVWPLAVCLPKDAPTLTRVCNLHRGHLDADVYIGRKGYGEDGRFGNPIRRGRFCHICSSVHQSRGGTIECYKVWFRERMRRSDFRKKINALQGKTLGCFCKPKPCHGDIIASYLMWEAGWRF